MSTVGRLIDYLSTLDPDEPILYQFLLAEHTSLTPEQFAEMVEESDDTKIYEYLTDVMLAHVEDWTNDQDIMRAEMMEE